MSGPADSEKHPENLSPQSNDIALNGLNGKAPDKNGYATHSSPDAKIDMDEKSEEKKEEVEPEDPWALPAFKTNQKPWKQLDGCGKVKRFFGYLLKIIALIVLLYFFICSLDFLSAAFRLLGGKTAGQVIGNESIIKSPIAGVIIGVLATVLLQSSSTTTSIVVTMVGAGILQPKAAIPLIMGANIGTSVTNTIVSIGHIGDKQEYRRAFAGATVHDMFNWLTVLILLPIEVATGYLFYLTKLIVDSMSLSTYVDGKQDLLHAITKPFTGLVIQIDKNVITKIATGNTDALKYSMIKIWCKTKNVQKPVLQNVTQFNATSNRTDTVEAFVNKTVKENVEKCKFMFIDVAETWGDTIIGAILLVVSLVILCFCLFFIVRTINSLLKGQIALLLRKFINANFPGKVRFLTGYLAILIGAGCTVLVQSSSIFTSAMTPLVGVGVLSLERMYPLTLGANIGTTATALLASLATTGKDLPNALQIAFVHLFFNVSGIIIWYPIPKMREVPIRLAKFLGTETEKYRWFAILYLVIMFFLFPGLILGLSQWSWIAVIVFVSVLGAILLTIFIIKLIQAKKPSCLPVKLRNWKFLPEFMRSLAPIDRILMKATHICKVCKCKNKKSSENFYSMK